MGTSRRHSPTEPVSELSRVKIVECGEPLVDFMKACPLLIQDKPRFHYRRETLVRESVAKMLDQATRNLPDGYRLAIIEGWRPRHIQRRMYEGSRLRLLRRYPDWTERQIERKLNQITAPPDAKVPPPHLTGGAVDVVLIRPDGSYHDHVSPFERYDPACFGECPGLSHEAMKTRAVLRDALLEAGLTNYPSEYWHWSYGDQGWAYRGGHAHAIYGATEPADYIPHAEDVSDEPLVLIEE